MISKVTGQPWCAACARSWARCSRCGNLAPVKAGTRDQPLCADCAAPDAGFWKACPGCGTPGGSWPGHAAAVTSATRPITCWLTPAPGSVRAGLEPLRQAIIGADRPAIALGWLRADKVRALLSGLAAGHRPLTHAALDEMPDSKTLRHLRSVLVASGALPARDEHLTRLEHWIRAGRRRPPRRRPEAAAALLRDLARAPPAPAAAARNPGHPQPGIHRPAPRHRRHRVPGLAGRTRPHPGHLHSRRPGRLDGHREHRPQGRDRALRALGPEPASTPAWTSPPPDGTAPPAPSTPRPAGTRPADSSTTRPSTQATGSRASSSCSTPSSPAAISRLTLDNVHAGDDRVLLHLGQEPILLPEPLAWLARHLIATRQGHATIGDHGTSPWLLPGGRPGQPISPYRLAERLHQIGIQPGPARSTALFQLAAEVPAAILARMLGIHINVAVAWQHASGGDWAAYAADISRRNTSQPIPSRHETPART